MGFWKGVRDVGYYSILGVGVIKTAPIIATVASVGWVGQTASTGIQKWLAYNTKKKAHNYSLLPDAEKNKAILTEVLSQTATSIGGHYTEGIRSEAVEYLKNIRK